MNKKPSKDPLFVYEKILSTTEFNGSDSECDFFINNLKNNIPFAFSRFNDGEMMGICMSPGVKIARGDQVVSEGLKNALIDSISHQQHNYYVGLTCPYCIPQSFYHAGKQLTLGNPHIVRAVSTTNRNWAKVISKMSECCAGKKVRYISGEDQDISFLKRCMNINIIDHVKTASKDSWSHFKEIESYINQINDGDLVLLSIGPTARILAQRWFKKRPLATFLDIGSNLDPFTRNVWHKCHLGWENGFNIQNKCVGCN